MRRALTALVVGALAIAVVACGDDADEIEAATDDGVDVTTAPTTEAGPTSASTSIADGSTGGYEAQPIEQPTGAEIRLYVEADDPALAALVDWPALRWVEGSGVTATVAAGSTDEQVVAICTSIATLVQDRTDIDAVAVQRAGADAPAVVAQAPDGACLPA